MDMLDIKTESAKWADKKNTALRKALIELATAVTAMKKAEASVKKAQKGVKGFADWTDKVDSMFIQTVGLRQTMEANAAKMNEEADDLWSYVLKERGMQTGG